MSKTKNSPKPPDKVPTRIRIVHAGPIRLEAQAIEGDKPPLRRFTMTAYTGGSMQLAGWRYPVVVDLAGLRVPKKSRPILKDHNAALIVGHTDEISGMDEKNVSGLKALFEKSLETGDRSPEGQDSEPASQQPLQTPDVGLHVILSAALASGLGGSRTRSSRSRP